MKKLKNLYFIASVFIAIALMLSACGSQNAPVSDAQDADAAADEQSADTDAALSEQGADAAADVTPEIHAIAYPEDYPTASDEYGASAFAGSLNHGDSKYYIIHDFYNMTSGDGLHILSNFETYQQTTEYTCGAASALMVLNWFGEKNYDEMQIGDLVEIDTSKGTSVEGMVKFFTELDWDVDYHADTDFRFESIEDAEAYLIETIDAGVPVMADWTDWAGHWQVIIGLDECGTDDPYDDVVILADPYDITDHYQDGYYTFPFGRFFDMWREGPCTQKTEPYWQPFVTARPKI